MADALDRLTSSEMQRFSVCPVRCARVSSRVESVADYFSVIAAAVKEDQIFWFRGHAKAEWSLTPWALRPPQERERASALSLISHFKRIAEIKIDRPPAPDEELMWAQIAQHYGLPTRLLDWTESAATAFFFACLKTNEDGMVFILNPVDLNKLTFPRKPRVLDPRTDAESISKYLGLSGRRSARGRYPIAVNPVWNSQRLMLQKGVSTVHGARFDLDTGRIPSLVAIPILSESKARLRAELERVGIDEMTIFPELEHACTHLTRKAGLLPWG